MGSMERNKGKRGEREVAELLRQLGFTGSRRGQQYSGGPDSPDVVGIKGVHIEVKRCERVQIQAWMKQAELDKDFAEVPAVVHRTNGTPWLITLPLCLIVDFALRVLDALPVEDDHA